MVSLTLDTSSARSRSSPWSRRRSPSATSSPGSPPACGRWPSASSPRRCIVCRAASPPAVSAPDRCCASAWRWLGLRIAAGDLLSLGVTGLALALATVAATLVLTVWLGRRLGVASQLVLLIGAGSAICGASAVARRPRRSTPTRSRSAALCSSMKALTSAGSRRALGETSTRP
ncbi:MAG: putative sulfate exporter family transporter [Solirubrobacterales bacterium]|nr:putative sulfate exporter family transporter [Solirubrobacterales bacterium]